MPRAKGKKFLRPDSKPSTARYQDGNEPRRCRAEAKGGGRCKRTKEAGYTVCRWHGAGGGRPITNGLRSRAMGRFRDAYHEALGKGDALFDLRENLAIMDVGVTLAAERAAMADTPALRKRALAVFNEVQAAKTGAEMRERLDMLGRLLAAGVEDADAIEDLTLAAERMSKRQEAAWNIRLSAAQAIHSRDLVTLFARMVEIIIQEAQGEASARILRRIDVEIMGSGEVAPRVQAAGGDQNGGAVSVLLARPGGVHAGRAGVPAVVEAEGDSGGAEGQAPGDGGDL